jgi:hypothetical protein
LLAPFQTFIVILIPNSISMTDSFLIAMWSWSS